MKRIRELMIVAVLAVGLAVVAQGIAGWATFKPPVTNNFTEHYYQELQESQELKYRQGDCFHHDCN